MKVTLILGAAVGALVAVVVLVGQAKERQNKADLEEAISRAKAAHCEKLVAAYDAGDAAPARLEYGANADAAIQTCRTYIRLMTAKPSGQRD